MMLDDQLFGLMMVARERGIGIDEALAMPYKHVLAWDVALQRRAVESRNRR
jgi:hypothetical protein